MIQDNYVPASVEKKTERIAAEKKELEAIRAAKKELIKKRREEWKSKGKKYHDELIKEEQHLIEAKREARNSGNFYMAPEAKVAFVIRIKGVNHIRPQVKKILRLLRLRQLNNGVFVKVNKATMNMIKRIEEEKKQLIKCRAEKKELIKKRREEWKAKGRHEKWSKHSKDCYNKEKCDSCNNYVELYYQLRDY